jgi:hypothetical protein
LFVFLVQLLDGIMGSVTILLEFVAGPHYLDVTYSTLPVSAYVFQYDKLNRMTLADYGSGYSGSIGSQAGFFNEHLTYDVMGNVLTLNRNSFGAAMDNPSYAYATNSNRVKGSSFIPQGCLQTPLRLNEK